MQARRPAPRQRSSSGRPRLLGAVAALVAAALVFAGCSSNDVVTVTVTTTPSTPTSKAPVTVTPNQAAKTTSLAPTTTGGDLANTVRFTVNPAFGSKNLGPTDPVTITAFAAKIERMDVTSDDGLAVKGTIGEGGATWTLAQRLKYNTTYTFNGVAVGNDGKETPITGKMSTVNPKETIRAAVQIPDGGTVGVAAPIIITFASAIQDKAAAEKALKVTVNGGKAIEGSWGWMQDEDIQGNGTKQSIVHFRPKDYWPAHTKVHLQADLYGVNYGNGWGREDVTRDFSIGRKLVVTADVNSFHMVVSVDDKIVANYAVSYGKESVPGRNTLSGPHVVTDKQPEVSMCNPEYGYCNVKEKWAVRINNNGEFIHQNMLAAPYFGKANVSHGCINMSDVNAKQFYDMVMYGDLVNVSGTSQDMSYKDTIWDWSVPYSTWQGFSAL